MLDGQRSSQTSQLQQTAPFSLTVTGKDVLSLNTDQLLPAWALPCSTALLEFLIPRQPPVQGRYAAKPWQCQQTQPLISAFCRSEAKNSGMQINLFPSLSFLPTGP